MLNREQKQQWTKQFKEDCSKSKVAFFADYKGLTATQADDLRKTMRTKNVKIKVLNNRVARLAAKDGSLGADAKDILDKNIGPTMVAFAFGDPAAAAKEITKFAEANEAFQLKVGLMDSKRIEAGEIKQLASLPTREVMLSILLGTMKAPIQAFAGVLAAVPRSLVTVLSAIEKKKAGQ